MARTPLLSDLQRLFRELAEADDRGITLDDLRAERAARAVTRRDFLRVTGAAAGLFALQHSGLSRAAAWSGAVPNVAIVGGGIAGLTAALVLHEMDVPFTVYEASSTVGGRMHSDAQTWGDGQVSEWCGQLIDSGHTVMRSLIRRYDLHEVDLFQYEPTGSTTTRFFDNRYYDDATFATDALPVLRTIREQGKAAGYPTTYETSTETGRVLDQTSIAEWIDRFVPRGHDSLLGQLLDVAYTTEYGRDAAEQSSLNLIYLIASQPFAPEISLYGESDERYWIEGGNGQLPQAIANDLPSGTVRTNHRLVRAVRMVRRYELWFDTGGARPVFVPADRVIFALPFSVLRGIDLARMDFSHEKLHAIRTLGYGTNSKLHVQFDSHYWQDSGPWGVSNGDVFTDLALQGGWDTSRGQPGTNAIFVDYTGGTPGTAFHPKGPYTSGDEVAPYAQQLVHELDAIFPGIASHATGRASLSCPWLDPNLLGSYSCWLVGQYTKVAGLERLRQGNAHFAGEHCSISFQGYMEGGAREGIRAAVEILADTGASRDVLHHRLRLPSHVMDEVWPLEQHAR